MKKTILSISVLLCCACGAFAQSLLSQNFSAGISPWTSSNLGTGSAWALAHNTFTDASFGAQTFNSPTASNGFALINSDGTANATSSELISPLINCSSASKVSLTFSSWIEIYNTATATVSVSTDNTNWIQVYDASNEVGVNPYSVQLDISNVAANEPTVYIKFSYSATTDLWWAVDDINVFVTPQTDVAVSSVDVPQPYGPINNLYVVNSTIENMGTDPLTSVTLNYTINDTAAVSQTLTGLNLATYQSAQVQFSTTANLATPSVYNIQVTSSAPNGGTDANPANDTAANQLTTLSHIPAKHVLIEEFTTVPCGYCPGGLTRIEEIMDVDSAFVHPVSIHAGFYTDGMTNSDDDALAAAFTDAAPTASIDRVVYPLNSVVAVSVSGMGYDSSYNNWKHAAEARSYVTPPVSLTASNTYDPGTRDLSVTVTANFYGPVTGNMRMNVYVIEDSVVGPDNQNYDQHTYYFSSPTTLNPWLGLGTYNSSAQVYEIIGYVQHRVERKLMDGVWGTAGVIPTTTADGVPYTKTFTYTLPTALRDNFVTLVPFVYNYGGVGTYMEPGKNEVLNSMHLYLNSTDSTSAPAVTLTYTQPSAINESELGKVSLYPNPARDMVYVNYTLSDAKRLSFQVYNTLGQLVSNVSEQNTAKGYNSTAINTSQFANGLYMVTIKDAGKVIQTLKFVVAK